MIESLNFDLQVPQADISKITMLLYGTPKIGKSTFCSRCGDHFFIATEPGLNHIEARYQLVQNWDDIKQVVSLLTQARGRFKTIIVDTADRMCDMLERSILDKYKIQSLGDLGFGKGSAIFASELKWMMDTLTAIGCGLVFVSHADSIDIDTPSGKVKKWVPSLPKAARKQILNFVDVIGFAESEYIINAGKSTETRVLHLAPSQIWEAGDRTAKFPPKIAFKHAVFKKYFEVSPQQSQQQQAQQQQAQQQQSQPANAAEQSKE